MDITPRENVMRLIHGENPSWIPFTMDVGGLQGFSKTIRRIFEEMTGDSDPAEYFDYDFRVVSVPFYFGGDDPARFHYDIPEDATFDGWGIGRCAGGCADTYERIYSPFSTIEDTQEIRAYPEPVLHPDGIEERVRTYHARGYPVVGYAGSIYEWSWWLRGMERFLADLLINPRLAEAVLDKVTYFTEKLAVETAAKGIDILAFYDDAGMQTGMQISPELWRHFIKPRWKRVLSAVRSSFSDTVFFFHSCGDITPIVPDIVELGFHILHPVQPECMNPLEMKKKYGYSIVFCGTLGAQRLFSFGSPDDVRNAAMAVMDTLGADRRVIICSSNIIQPETPWENILAFERTARTYHGGRYAKGMHGNI